jgi:hypothetical protein
VKQNLERLLDLLLRRPASDIEEVGRGATIKLDNVHSGHRKTSTIHQAPNVASELDVVEIVESGKHLMLLLLFGRRGSV